MSTLNAAVAAKVPVPTEGFQRTVLEVQKDFVVNLVGNAIMGAPPNLENWAAQELGSMAGNYVGGKDEWNGTPFALPKVATPKAAASPQITGQPQGRTWRAKIKEFGYDVLSPVVDAAKFMKNGLEMQGLKDNIRYARDEKFRDEMMNQYMQKSREGFSNEVSLGQDLAEIYLSGKLIQHVAIPLARPIIDAVAPMMKPVITKGYAALMMKFGVMRGAEFSATTTCAGQHCRKSVSKSRL